MNKWKITWDEHQWTDDQVLGAHLVAVADLLGGDSWTSISPWSGVKALSAWIVVLLTSVNGGDADEALAEVYGATGAKILGSLATRE